MHWKYFLKINVRSVTTYKPDEFELELKSARTDILRVIFFPPLDLIYFTKLGICLLGTQIYCYNINSLQLHTAGNQNLSSFHFFFNIDHFETWSRMICR
jgi:hypothetical protein